MTTNTNAQTVKSAPLAESASNTNHLTEMTKTIITQDPGNMSSVRFKVGLNHKTIDKNNPERLAYIGAWEPTETTFAGLSNHIGKGHAWMPALLDVGARRLQENANCTEVLSIDVDNTTFEKDANGKRVKGDDGKFIKIYAAEMTLEDAVNHPYISAHCGLIQPSSSHKTDWHKFRLAFALQTPIIGHANIVLANTYLAHLVGAADPSCKNADRPFFGALNSSAYQIQEVTLPASFFDDALAWHEANQVKAEKVRVERAVFGIAMPKHVGGDMTADEFEMLLLAWGSGNGYVRGSGTNQDYFRAMTGTARQFGAYDTRRIWTRWESQNPGEWTEPFDKILDRTIVAGTNNDYFGKPATFASAIQLLKDWGYEPPKRKQIQLTQEEKQSAFEAMLEAATEATTRLWPVTKSFNQRYISADLITLKEGVITMLSSACGSGKTVAAKAIITAFAKALGMTFDELTIRIPGYRNALGQQTAKRWGIAHIHDLRKDEKPDDVAQLSLCVDSILNIKLESIGLYEVWVLDEVVNVLKHVLSGDTLGARHGEILQHLFQCLNKVLRQGGTVLCMEEDITDYAISSLSNLLGGAFPIELYENTFYGNQYDVKIGAGHISGWQAAIIRDLVAGQKLVVVADSQKLLEQLEYAIVNAGMTTNILRVDSTTKDAEVVQKFMTTPDTILEKGGYQLVLMSPTAESGTSIELPGFNKVYASFSHLDTRSQIQMLERYRLSVPRIIHCRESDKRNAHRLDVVNILEQDKARMIRSIKQSNVLGQLCDVIDNDPNNERLVKWSVDGQIRLTNVGNDAYETVVNTEIATFEVQSTALKIRMLENLAKNMKRRGNTVSLCEWQYDKSTHDAFAIAKEQRTDVHATRLHEAPGDMEPEVASAIIQTGRCNRETMENALKSMLIKVELLGVAERIDFEFIREVVTKGNKKLIKQVTLALAIVYPEIAMSRDAQRLIGKGPNIWKRAGSLVDQRNFMAMIIERCGYPQADQEYGNNSQECIDAYTVAYANREAYKLAFGKELRNLQEQVRDAQGVVIQEAYTVGMFYREMMRNLGWKAKATKRISEQGQRTRLYVFNLDCEFRQIVLDGLQNKYAETIEKAHQQSVTVETSSSVVDNVVTNKRLDGQQSLMPSVTEKCIGLYKNMADIIIENGGHQENFTYSWA